MRKFFLIVLCIILGAVILGGLYFWNQVSWPVSSSDQEVIFTAVKGEGVKDISANLLKAGLIRNTFWFETFVFLDRSQAKFMAGDYLLKKNMNIREIVHQMTGGTTSKERSITIKEGWNVNDTAKYLSDNGIVNSADFLKAAAVSDSRTIIPDKVYDFLKDKPTGQGLEGYLFPDTYRILKTAQSPQIIERMLNNFDVKYDAQMRADTVKGNMTIYQIITLASIIEKEVRSDTDRKIAAGIFYNRLNSGIALQSDATVNYVTGKQALQPTNEDISVDNLYNTYKYTGLPPGPICNPSLSALQAAVYPEKTDYFYFLTKPDGSTVFSQTYEEHLFNKQKYLQ